MNDYYNRNAATHLDGTMIFQNEEDQKNERSVAERVEAAWGCSLRQFGKLAPLDWYAERHGRLVGLLELKSRTHAHDKFGTTFLNIRKWFALTMGAAGLGVPGIFVVKFTDGIWWKPIAEVDATQHKIGGCFQIVKSRSDIEPQIHVPVESMRRLKETDGRDRCAAGTA
jgi:hypothetical protein